jgi:hypothetical protein
MKGDGSVFRGGHPVYAVLFTDIFRIASIRELSISEEFEV